MGFGLVLWCCLGALEFLVLLCSDLQCNLSVPRAGAMSKGSGSQDQRARQAEYKTNHKALLVGIVFPIFG